MSFPRDPGFKADSAALPASVHRRRTARSRQVAGALAAALLIVVPLAAADAAPRNDGDTAFVNRLLARMTLEEKVGQLTIVGADRPDLEQLIREGRLGGTNGVLPGRDVLAYTQRLQHLAMRSPLRIPLWFMGDVTHGFRTIFPVPLALAASWDPALVERVDRAAADEATAAGVDWTFGPMVDITRDPRWGRVVESSGEDPFLGTAMALAHLRGFQGGDLGAAGTMMATAKHFAGYGAVEAGRDYNSVYLPPRLFHDVYLPPFHALADAGIGSFMAAFTTLDGVPATADRKLLTGILRQAWGYRGLIVSDFDAVPELQTHEVAATPADAARLALHAGIDVDLHSGTYLATLPDLVRRGRVPEAEVDAAVRRVLEAKCRLGLFDDPFRYGDATRARRVTFSAAHRALAREAARESMVLLKNRANTLPLSRHLHLAVIGPLADARTDLLGPMHALGVAADVTSILTGIRAAVDGTGRVSTVRGVGVAGDDGAGIGAAVRAARSADVAILVLGESLDMIGEGNSRAHLGLPGRQLDLAKAVVAAGRPVVVVLVSGRPLAIPWLHDHADAILDAWLPGDEGGPAVADLLFGEAAPSGRLPMTFPRAVGQVPIYYAHLPTGRPRNPTSAFTLHYSSHYVDEPNTPLYPFGYGLSYTTFAYGPVRLDRSRLAAGGTLRASVRLTNTGTRRGTEVVQLYLHDEVASVSPPVRVLRGFRRVELAPGASTTVTFALGATDLAFWRGDGSYGAEPGTYDVYVGSNATADEAGRARFVFAPADAAPTTAPAR